MILIIDGRGICMAPNYALNAPTIQQTPAIDSKHMLTLITIHVTTNALITTMLVCATLCYVAWTSTRRPPSSGKPG